MDLFDGSQSAFEPSLKAIKEAPPKLSLSNIVEVSSESMKIAPEASVNGSRIDVSGSHFADATSASRDAFATSALTKTGLSTAATEKSVATTTMDRSGVTGYTGVTSAVYASSAGVLEDDNEEPTRQLEDILPNTPVGRGSLPNLSTEPFETSYVMSRHNYSCPNFGGRNFDFLIEIHVNGEPLCIGCFANDDPRDIARDFIIENNIDSHQLEALTEFIANQMADEQEREEGEKPTCNEGEELDEEEQKEEKEEKGTDEDEPLESPKEKSDQSDNHHTDGLEGESGEMSEKTSTELNEEIPKEKEGEDSSSDLKKSSSASPLILNLTNGDDYSLTEKIFSVSKPTRIAVINSSVSSLSSGLSGTSQESPSADNEATSSSMDISSPSKSPDVEAVSTPLEKMPHSPSSDDVSSLSEAMEKADVARGGSKGEETEKESSRSSETSPVTPVMLDTETAIQESSKTQGNSKRSTFADWRGTAALDFNAPIEKSRRGSRLSLVKRTSILSQVDAPPRRTAQSRASFSDTRRMSRLLRNGKTFLDTSPVKTSPTPQPPLMSLVDVVGDAGKEIDANSAVVQGEAEVSSNTTGISSDATTAKAEEEKPPVFKMPQFPAPKPKVAVRKSTRASTANSRDNAQEERETKRRSIMRNLRRSKKIVFSPEAELVFVSQESSVAEESASPVLDRKVTRRMTVAPRTKDVEASLEKRRATLMTPIQKLAQWRRGSMMVTPSSVGSSKSTPLVVNTPSNEGPSTNDGQTSKAARNLNMNFQAVVAPTDADIEPNAVITDTGAKTTSSLVATSPLTVEPLTKETEPDALTHSTTPKGESPVVVLKRLSSEEIASFTAPVMPPPTTPAWERSRRLLKSPVVMISPLVRHLHPAIAELSLCSPQDDADVSLLPPHDGSFHLNESMDRDDARSRVLEVCGQETEVAFYDVYPKVQMAAMKKIGEGTYGEVYLSFDEATKRPVALKVIPIEGDDLVNDERQKTYAEMLSEAVITKEMSELSSTESENQTSGFIRVNRICAFKGKYPAELLKKWDEWNKKNKSWNDRPDFYAHDQLFLVFEFSEGGSDLEKFRFSSPADVMSVFRQTMLALAVGEAELEFEHRDLHWGNVLIKKLDAPETIVNVLDGKSIEMTASVRVSIIDFTLSRLKRGGLTQFTDLAEDPDIFKGPGEDSGDKNGDYQFDCYRLMQEETKDCWKPHTPKTNVIWLRYLAKKLISKMKAMTKKQKAAADWKAALNRLKLLQENLLGFASVADALKLIEAV